MLEPVLISEGDLWLPGFKQSRLMLPWIIDVGWICSTFLLQIKNSVLTHSANSIGYSLSDHHHWICKLIHKKNARDSSAPLCENVEVTGGCLHNHLDSWAPDKRTTVRVWMVVCLNTEDCSRTASLHLRLPARAINPARVLRWRTTGTSVFSWITDWREDATPMPSTRRNRADFISGGSLQQDIFLP